MTNSTLVFIDNARWDHRLLLLARYIKASRSLIVLDDVDIPAQAFHGQIISKVLDVPTRALHFIHSEARQQLVIDPSGHLDSLDIQYVDVPIL